MALNQLIESSEERIGYEMSRNLIRMVVATVVVAATSLAGAGMATAVTAEPAPTVSSTADGYQVETEELTYTFSHEQSVALYNAAKDLGAGAAGDLCARWSRLASVACEILAEFIIDALTDPPAADECYQVYARVGLPPFGARVVNC